MKQIWYFIKENRNWYILIAFLLLIVNAAQLAMPLFIGSIIDFISTENPHLITDISPIWINTIYFLIASLSIVFGRIIYINIMRKFAIQFEHTKRKQLFKKYMDLPNSFFFTNEIGDLMARANNDTIAVRRFLVMGLLSIYDIFVLGIGALTIMFFKAPKLTMWIFIPLAILAILAWFVSKKMHPIFKIIQETFADITTQVRETLVGMNVIRTFCKEKYYFNRFTNICTFYLKTNLDLAKLMGVFHPAIELIIQSTVLVITVVGGYQVMTNVISLGVLVEFTQYIQLLAWPMMAIGFVVNMYQRASISINRIYEILATPSADASQRILLKPTILFNKITFKNLTYSYPEQSTSKVLTNFSITINKGENIGITGPTGSGKTTFLALLLRIWDPAENTIFIDDHDISHLDLNTLRQQFAYVPQVSFLFSDTVWENLKFGNPEASEEKIMEAAKIARVFEDVKNLQNGFKTVIGERGVTLSGGQKQRLSLARAIVADRQCLILDDSLSAVDPETEEIIISNLKKYMRETKKTSIIISHRITTLNWLDKVGVIENGELTEFDSPGNLIDSQNGYYYRLYHYQYLKGLEGLKNGV
ncbi:MAG: ABC transporter ATP-binding protein [Caldisericia bacterium]|nr:ABC transporter ATP-binding protein [Caldisericia bacterium]